MRKKVVIVLLGSMILPATVWAQYKPYYRQNTSGYVFDGHKLEDVLVKPYAGDGETQTKIEKNAAGHWEVTTQGTYLSKTISVAKTDDDRYDDQTVYLYNRAAGLFLNVSGTWGTEAVGLYPGFGLAFNIVDPSGTGNNHKYAEHWKNDTRWGVGFYSEAFNMGHYMSRDGDKHAGEPTFPDGNGNLISKIRFYTDRGGNEAGYVGSEEWNTALKCHDNNDWSWAENNHIFTWHFEEIKNDPTAEDYDPNLHVYRLYQYIRNSGRNGEEGVDNKENTSHDKYYRHYVKFEKINPFNENPFYALTTARANEVEWKGEGNEQHRFVNPSNLINTNETSEMVDGYADKDYYEWQIITRRDLKEKFLLDFNDPYATESNPGNANFNLENPDFSRPLYTTITKNNAISWEDKDEAYKFSGDAFGNAPYGRYAYLHPEKNGEFTQVFEPYQFGLFDVEVQGFTLKAHDGSLPTAKLWVTTDDATKIGYTGEVTFDQISEDDKKDLYQRIGDIAREQLTREWRYKNQVGDETRGVTNSHVFTYTNENPEPSSDDDGEWKPGFRSVRADNGVWILTTMTPSASIFSIM